MAAVNFIADFGAAAQNTRETLYRPRKGKLRIYCYLPRRRRTGEIVTYTVLTKSDFQVLHAFQGATRGCLTWRMGSIDPQYL